MQDRLFDVEAIPDTKAEIQELFELWVSTYRTRGKLNEKRKAKLAKALKEYDYETVRLAILGLQYSPFHMGENMTGDVYDELELILRDSAHIERFARLGEENAR